MAMASKPKSNGHLSTKIVVDPPNLAEWRQKLFNVDDIITLSEEEYVVSEIKQSITNLGRVDSKHTSHTWTTYTLIDQLNATSASRLSRTIGIVDSKEDPQEPPNPMTRTRRSANVLLESEISAMSKSRLQSTFQALCCGLILYQMEAKSNNRTPPRETISLRLDNPEDNQSINSSSLACHWSTLLWEQVIQVRLASDTTQFSVSTAMVEMAKAMEFQDHTNTNLR